MASEPITSDDNELTLRYVQAGGFQSKKIFGFSGHFTTLCTGIVLNSISGNIQSPGYPYRVYVNQFCSWTIRVPKGNRILVTVHHFSISQKTYYSGIICQTDMLKVDDTDLAEAEVTFKKTEYNTTNTVNRYCDKAIPRKIRSKHNTMKLTYMSSQDPTNQFWLSWSTVGCSRDINLPQQLIISKEHIDAEVDEFECQYKIEAPVGKQINLMIEKLDILPIESECSYKKDAHFNGFAIFMGSSNASAVPFQTYCTQISQQNISSHTNELFLFLSMNKDRLKSNVFFNATIEFVDIPESSPSDTCGRIINLERGVKNSIVSPGFPAPYPVGVMCKWLINAPPGYHIEYTVEEYHTPNYHEERTVKQRIVNPFSSSNVSCQWQLPYSDGMLSFYIGNRSTTSPFEKVCEETTTPRVLEMYATQSLVVFEGASSIMGQKSGEGSRERNGMWLSIRPRCGGVVYAESKPQTVSLLYENDEDVCNITIKKKDPEDSDIYIRLEEYTKINASSQHTIDDRIDIYSGEELKNTVMLKATDNTMQEYTSDEDVKISVRHGNAPHSAILVVSTDEKNCGGEVRHSQGTIYAPERQLDKPFDCGWTISNNIGNTVTLSVLDHNLVYTPNCTESYIEVRADNSSGKLLKRQCDVSTIDSTEFEAQSLYVFLRYRPSSSDSSDDDDDDVQDPDQQDSSKRPLFKARYEKVSGGRPKNRYVANPVIDDVEMMVWTLDAVDENAGILVKFSELYLSSTSYLRFSEADEIGDVANVGFEEVSGFVIPAEKFFETNLIRVYGKIAKADRFVFTWDPVPLNYKNMTVEKSKKKVYDCGGYLTATYDWDSFTNPLPAGQSFGYEENLHCRWTITRPMFTGIELKFEYLDLEDVENCAYDFVSFKLQFDDQPDDDDAEVYAATKHCALASSNMTFHYSVNRALHIHFVTDKSRHGVGFKLNYRLTCSGFEHIRPGAFFEHTLQSPNFDGKVAQRDWDCQFTLILESNRPITVEIVELDIEEKSPCATDNVLILANKFIELISTYTQYAKASKFCGKLEPGERVNFTSTRGRLFMKYFAKSSSRKGFKLIMREKMAECPSGILNLDENTPSRVLQSPEFPQRIPNSVECEYVMAAPNGHRVMLTFDADQFDISGDPKNCETLDYVEIRNGPSEHSELVGTFCGNQPPSTIFSTSNFLYMKLHTSEYGRSRRFIAKYEIATCGGTIIVRENYTSHILSPNFPDPYNTPVQCEWNVRSPNTHMIEAKVDHLWIFYNQNCTMEQLTIRDGDSNSKPLIGPACVALRIPNSYTRSASNQLTVQFSSNASVSRGGRQYCSQKKCGFDVAVKLSEEKCGGIITNAMGTLKPPGYPGRLLPHVKCVWDFKAKPGMVFMFKLNFLREDSYRKIEKYTMAPTKQLCFPDLSIVEGFPPYDGAQFSQSFCRNQSQITSRTDITRLVYDDSFTREAISVLANDALQNVSFYAPFSIDYMVIPANKDNGGCTYHVTSNISMDFHSNFKANNTVVRVDAFCHIAIEKPLNTASVYIKIENYGVVSQQDTRDISTCHSWGAHIRIQSNEPTPIQKVVCEASAKLTNRTEMIYINPQIDILIIQIFREQEPQDFSLTVEFHSCGGAITTPNSGEITSPNNGYTYLSNSKCRWVLEAPEGQIVKVKIVEMRIEYDHECKNDRLLIGEGRQAELNTIHTYCHILDGDVEQKLEDRLRTIRSRGRFLTLQWETDSKFELSGWKVQYEFVNENEECGFHTRGMSGVIHTPKFGENDYENDLECVWDVQVPIGYHVSLKYRDFDVEASENCEKDKLVISQEHSTRANSPNGEYYFFFQDEEKETPLCGIEHPKDFESESNRLRLNFTTDSKTTARGFRIDWEAKCGTIYRLNNGVITSPHYPEGYPNEAVTCTYLIAPMDQNSVIAIKFSDFDLSNLKTSYGRTPCESDYLQIIETSSERVLYNLCGGDKMPEDALVIKGPVGLVFVTSVDWTVVNGLTLEKPKKNFKGFQLAYSINKCGDSIDLREGNRLSTSIKSPAFPLPYTKNLDCVWNITTDSNRQLSVRFEKLSLESFTDCTADFVELYDSPDMIFNKSLGKFCGSMKNIPLYRLVTTGPYLLVHMKTDFTVNGGGFKLIVTATLGEKDGCSGKLKATNEWKTLSSPQDEDGNYPPNLMCGWSISGPVNSQLRIRIDGVDTEKLEYPPGVRPKPECIDALAIYDGQEFVSPILAGDICTSRTPIPKLLYTSHRHAFVTFETDQDGTGKGFNLSYSVVQNECGGWLQATTEMKTLIYKGISLEENKEMNKERSHQRCRFMIQATVTDPVIIYFKQFNIPSKAGDCSDSYLEIRDVGSLQECKHPACAREPGQRKTTKLCGSHVPYSHISVTNTIQIIVSAEIVTAANNSRPMFKIEYNLLDNCNRTIDTSTVQSGRITSPNFPNPYSENSTCTTQLQTSNKKILIVFNEFMLEDRESDTKGCEYDSLLIKEDDGTNGTYYCGQTLPASLLTSGKDLVTILKSDHSVNHGGYDASYFTVVSERDDQIQFANSYELEGVISSIGYPNGYNMSFTQIFKLMPPGSHDCSIIFSDLNIGLSQNEEECTQPTEEYLDFEVRIKDQVKKARIRDCTLSNKNTRELILEADSNDRCITFTFKSDGKSENDGRGFKIRWKCIGRTNENVPNDPSNF